MKSTYDANGSVLSTFGRHFAWNTQGQLAQVRTEEGTSEERDGQLLKYVFSGSVRLARLGGVPPRTLRPGAPVYPGALYYVGDHLQSTSLVTDASGKVVAEAAYDVWGQQVVGTTEPYTYTGHEWDAEAGLCYAGSRYYDPKLGRFLSVDPATLDNPGPLFQQRARQFFAGAPVYLDEPGKAVVLGAARLSALGSASSTPPASPTPPAGTAPVRRA